MTRNVWGGTPAPIAIYAKKNVPEVQDACRITENGKFRYLNTTVNKLLNGITAWLMLLSSACLFPFIEGDPQHPFTDAHSIVLSETTAKKFFGNETGYG